MSKFTREQAIIVMGFTGVATCPFDWFHEDVERRMGRGVWTHEMGSGDFWKECRRLYRADFLALCLQGPNES